MQPSEIPQPLTEKCKAAGRAAAAGACAHCHAAREPAAHAPEASSL
jgi:hypothetical protein